MNKYQTFVTVDENGGKIPHTVRLNAATGQYEASRRAEAVALIADTPIVR